MPMRLNYASHCPVFLLERQEGSSPCMQQTAICCGLVNRGGRLLGRVLCRICLTVDLPLEREQISPFYL